MKPDFARAKSYVFGRLARELPPQLTYHSLWHTRDDVLPAARRLSRCSRLDDETRLLLATAALFHDTGFLHNYNDHESEGIAIARAALPGLGYSSAQVEAIGHLIAATCMPQQPSDDLQALMCDADLDLLGREDFWGLNRKLLAELRHYGLAPESEAQWLTGQTRFLEEHRYFSAAARALRDEGKARNIALMHRALEALNGSGGPYVEQGGD
ncbi:phosphohydrolase [Promineifilum sp.]|uniref:HD domain-containing protein n=1 Tax=Promineifilum sp. TaxID=2664178 RepID=UPI0035AFF67F